jgi:hypothetical protein
MQKLPVYDVVLLPAAAQYQKSIDISRQLASYGTEFTLDAHGPFPHMSLYMANFTLENLAKAELALAEIAAKTSAMTLEAVRYAHDLEQGMFEIGYEMPDELVNLQNDIVVALNPLRTGLQEKDPVGHVIADWLLQAPAAARQNLEQFGYDEIGELFRPHITFTRFRQRDLEIDTTNLLPLPMLSADFPTLALYETGDHGTCTRKTAAFSLGVAS